MADKSAIEWTDATWNPVTGCTKVSPACANCYIDRTPPFRVRNRVFVNGHIPLELHPARLEQPLRRRKPTVYFVNSLSDLFHDDIPDAYIDRVFAVMALSYAHTFQLLTKRPARMRAYLTAHHVGLRWLAAIYRNHGGHPNTNDMAYQESDSVRWTGEGLPNVWLGVSVENQHFAQERIPLLRSTPAAVRFISAEPLLSPLELTEPAVCDHIGGHLSFLDWVIVGGESGPSIRPTRPEWIRGLRDQCVAAGVPFFFKQWGGRTSKAGGRILDGRTWDEMPPFPARLTPPDEGTAIGSATKRPSIRTTTGEGDPQ